MSWCSSVPAWLTWSVACNRLARDRGLALYYGPVATLGWWFVPIANVYVPLRVIAEQWRASAAPHPGAWQSQPVSRLVIVWWFSLLALIPVRASVFVVGLDLVEMYTGDVTPLRDVILRDVLQHGLGILTASLGLVLVSRISTGLRRDLD